MYARLSLLMFLVYATMGSWVPMLSVRLDQLGFSPDTIGLISATAALAYLAAPVAAGQLADRWLAGERCIALCAAAAGTLLWLLAGLNDPTAVFWVSLAFWLVTVPVTTVATALTFHHLENPARHFGKVRVWGTVGWAAAAWLVGLWLWLGRRPWWDELIGISTSLADIFHCGALMCFALAAYALTLPHTPPRRHGQDWLAPLQALRLLRHRDFAVYLVCSLLLYTTIPFNSQTTPLLLAAAGVPAEYLGPVLTLGQSMEIGLLLVLPVLLDRLGVRGTLWCGIVTWTAGLGVFALGEPRWLLVTAVACNGVCVACFMVGGQVFLNSRAHGPIRASTQSLLVFVNGVGLLGGNLLAGWVRGQTAPAFAPTYLTAVAVAGALVLFFHLGFPRPAVEVEETAPLATPACVGVGEDLQ